MLFLQNHAGLRMLPLALLVQAALLLLAFQPQAAVGASARALKERYAFGFPAPTQDPWYRAPSNLSSLPNGKLIKTRGISTPIDGTYTKAVFQAQYRTNTAQGAPDAAALTVFIPKQPSSSPKIWSYQVYIDSVNVDCAPSWALVQNSDSQNKGILQYDPSYAIPWARSQGWHVLITDYLGTQSAFTAGFAEGRAILDAIRATKSGLNLPSNTKVVLSGYSGAGHATAWAVDLAGSYAPELNIVGATYGGTGYDPTSFFPLVDGGKYSTFAILSLLGIGRAYPDFQNWLASASTDFGKALAGQSRSVCLYSLPSYWEYVKMSSLLNGGLSALKNSVAAATFNKNSLMARQSTPAKFPRLIYAGTADQIIPISDVRSYVSQQCQRVASGAGGSKNLQFIQYQDADHFATSDQAKNTIGAWVQAAFSGSLPAISSCGSAR